VDPLIIIPALGDNFIYLYQYDSSNVLVVDPSDSSSVLSILKKRKLNLTTILITHHHWDHIAGAAELKSKTGCRIIGGDKQRTPAIDIAVDDGQILTIGDAKIQVIATPGHTRTSVCYYMPPSGDNRSGILWTGDTMFIGGCGRLLECDAQVMLNSLRKLASLPEATLVYCGHDYTVENYEFALSIEPSNQAIKQRLQQIEQAEKASPRRFASPAASSRPLASFGRRKGGGGWQSEEAGVPSTILQEKMTNPFLRADAAEIKEALHMTNAQPVEVFAELRRRKDIF